MVIVVEVEFDFVSVTWQPVNVDKIIVIIDKKVNIFLNLILLKLSLNLFIITAIFTHSLAIGVTFAAISAHPRIG